MNKNQVRSFLSAWAQGNTAEYVVAHAKWQDSRGRRPSESYKNEGDPKKALKLALDELRLFNPVLGEHLSTAAERMVRIVHLTNQPLVASFNEFMFVVTNTTKIEDIIIGLEEALEKQHVERLASPEGQQHIQEQEALRVENQNKVDYLIMNLPDFNDPSAVITWFGELQDPSDNIGVTVPWQWILDTFKEHGFRPGMNTYSDFDNNDPDNFAHWLVGEALSDLKEPVHAIHFIYHQFAEEWRTKFGQTQ